MLISHSKPSFDKAEEEAILHVLRSNHIAMGEKVAEFERQLKLLTQRQHAVCVDSGFSALRLALLGLDVQKDDVIALPAYACVALINAVLSVGAKPLLLDIHADNFTVDAAFVTPREKIKAAIVVHTFGYPVNIQALKEKLNVPIIEDCAHALGQGSFGKIADIAIASFYTTKLIGIGEGGCLLTDDPMIHARIVQNRNYTDKKPSATCFNHKMTDIEAAIGICQLEKLPAFIEQRFAIASRYSELLQELQSHAMLVLPTLDVHRIWYRFVIQLKNNVDTTIHFLKSRGIHAERPIENWGVGAYASDLSNSNVAFERNLSLPIYPALKEEELCFTVATLKEFLYGQ